MLETTTPGRSTRTTLLGVLAVAAVVAPAAWFGVQRWVLDDSAEAVPTDEVVAEFREATAPTASTALAPTTPAPATTPASDTPSAAPATEPVTATTPTTEPSPPFELPAPGVYRYTTVGYEAIDALGGARHDYPTETTITITNDGCGVRLRWDALRERREEWRLCIIEAGVEVQPDSVQYHEFFDRGEEEPVECDRGVLIAAEPDADVTEQECYRVDEAWLPVWQVVGAETLLVDGEPVDTVHVRQQVVDEDEHWEYTTIDWYLTPAGLPVRVVNVKESKSPTLVGDVVYEEEYLLDVVSLTPVT